METFNLYFCTGPDLGLVHAGTRSPQAGQHPGTQSSPAQRQLRLFQISPISKFLLSDIRALAI